MSKVTRGKAAGKAAPPARKVVRRRRPAVSPVPPAWRSAPQVYADLVATTPAEYAERQGLLAAAHELHDLGRLADLFAALVERLQGHVDEVRNLNALAHRKGRSAGPAACLAAVAHLLDAIDLAQGAVAKLSNPQPRAGHVGEGRP